MTPPSSEPVERAVRWEDVGAYLVSTRPAGEGHGAGSHQRAVVWSHDWLGDADSILMSGGVAGLN
jgi:hypothetical protein